MESPVASDDEQVLVDGDGAAAEEPVVAGTGKPTATASSTVLVDSPIQSDEESEKVEAVTAAGSKKQQADDHQVLTVTVNGDDADKEHLQDSTSCESIRNIPWKIARNKGTVIVTLLAAAGSTAGAYFLLNHFSKDIFESDDSNDMKKETDRILFGAIDAAVGITGGLLGFGAARLTNFFCNKRTNDVEMGNAKEKGPNEQTPLMERSGSFGKQS